MNRILLTLATTSLFVMGCGKAAIERTAAPAPAVEKAEAARPAAAKPAPIASSDVGVDAEPSAPAAGARMPGDFVVYRFTGSFRKTPLTLTERVIARKGAILTIDLTAAEGADKQELRVRVDESTGTQNEVVSVARLDHGREIAADLSAYDALMARTTLAADSNEATVGTEEVTIDIGGAAIPAKKTTYRVRVGKRSATLRTFESTSFAWGDVGGEIITSSGKVLYRAEVIDAGHEGAARASAFAK